MTLGLCYAALFFLQRIFEEWKMACYYRVDQQIRRDQSLGSLQRFFYIPFSQISKTPVEYAMIVDRGLFAIQGIFYQLVFHLLPVVCEIILATLILGLQSGVWIGIISFVWMATYLFVTTFIIFKIKDKEQVFYEQETKNFQMLSEFLRFDTTIRSHNVIGWVVKRYSLAMNMLISKALDYLKPQMLVGFFEGLILFGLMSMTMVVVITYPGSQADKVAQLVLVSGLLLQMVGSLRSFSFSFDHFIHNWAKARQLLDMMNLDQGTIKRPHQKLPASQGAYRLENLEISYGKAPILSVPFLEIPRVPILAIVGDTGAGKSLLAKALAGITQCSGKVHCFAPISKVYYCAQSVEIFDLTLEENMALGEHFSLNQIDRALRMAGFSDQEKKLLKGRSFGEQGKHISGGQKKRIGIARMMMRDAQVMIFDEPTAELNEEAAREVIAALQLLSTKNMVIVTTHSEEVMAICQMHIRIEKGHVWIS